ncbi:hypothetical protein R5O87_14460 [Arthrobacter globiformis]|uniref:hypothetical protein n=1 Tax=Arthrobacter globiformis TaxID=1665 RepID=UPI00397DB3A5
MTRPESGPAPGGVATRTVATSVEPEAGHWAPGRPALSKVPEIAAWFWVVKVLTTGMGETASDFLLHQLEPEVALAAAEPLAAPVCASRNSRGLKL